MHALREKGEQGQGLRDGPRGPMPFSDRPLSSSRRSFRVGLTLERARRPKGVIPNSDQWKPWAATAHTLRNPGASSNRCHRQSPSGSSITHDARWAAAGMKRLDLL
jgi:hypothetical protein